MSFGVVQTMITTLKNNENMRSKRDKFKRSASKRSISKKPEYDFPKATPEQLEENCYPLPDPNGEKGRAVVKEDPWRPKKPQPTEKGQRVCDRCLRRYKVDKTGRQIEQEECVHHWGRLFKKRGNRGE